MRNIVLAAAAGMTAMFAGSANAVFIDGAISFADGFDVVPAPPNLTCVIDCGTDNYDINNIQNVYSPASGMGDFSTTTSATAADFSVAGLPIVMFTTDSGFSFNVTNIVEISSTPLSCAGGLCSDSITYALSGVVSGAGFDDTAFIGNWTANGVCSGAGALCVSNQSASWSSSIVALARAEVPEPGTLVLLSMGLLGLGFARRRRSV